MLKLLNDQRVRFLIVGILNTVVGYGAFAFFIYLGIHYLYSNLFSTILGVLNSYYFNKYFTFNRPKVSGKEAFRFIFVYAISYLLGNFILFVGISQLHYLPYLVGAFNIVCVTIISWFGHKYYSFK